MKFVVCLLVLLPMVYCDRIEERFLNLHLSELVAKLKHALGSDTSLHACELACPALAATIPGVGLLAGTLCPLACHELVKLANGK